VDEEYIEDEDYFFRFQCWLEDQEEEQENNARWERAGNIKKLWTEIEKSRH
jgi:hypothetical protein